MEVKHLNMKIIAPPNNAIIAYIIGLSSVVTALSAIRDTYISESLAGPVEGTNSSRRQFTAQMKIIRPAVDTDEVDKQQRRKDISVQLSLVTADKLLYGLGQGCLYKFSMYKSL